MLLQVIWLILRYIVSGALLWFFFYYPPSYVQLHGEKSRKRDELKKINFVGVFLLIAGLSLFLLGISWGEPMVP